MHPSDWRREGDDMKYVGVVCVVSVSSAAESVRGNATALTDYRPCLLCICIRPTASLPSSAAAAAASWCSICRPTDRLASVIVQSSASKPNVRWDERVAEAGDNLRRINSTHLRRRLMLHPRTRHESQCYTVYYQVVVGAMEVVLILE